MPTRHRPKVYRTLEEWLAKWIDTPEAQRKARREWAIHVKENGNVPIVTQCSICSGEAEKRDRKRGLRKPRRPSKRLRNETHDH